MVPRLLIIEDHPETARHLADAFVLEGFDVRVVATAEHGLAIALAEHFDVVILDHYLPLKSGLDLLPELRERVPGVPVIFVTGPGHPKVMSAASQAGAFACVEKHLNYVPILIAKTRDALANRSLSAGSVVRTTFVGRKAELHVLEQAMLHAREGRGGLAFVIGEAGIGKSTLARQVTNRARELGMLAVTGRCRSADGESAYAPWLEIYHFCREWIDRHAATEGTSSERAYLDHLVSQLESTVPRSWDADLAESSMARLQRFRRIVSYFRQLAARQPLLIVLEDVHLMDSASLQLLAFLAEYLDDAPILLLGTYRDREYAGRDATIVELKRIGADGYLIVLGPLSLDETTQYLELATDWRPSASSILFLFRSTEGHPWFVAEVLKLLAAKGYLGDAQGMALDDLPSTKLDAIDRRLRLLPEAHLVVLRHAALVGRRFHLAILRDAVSGLGDQVRAAVDEAILHGLLVDTEDPEQVCFSHGLIKEELARRWRKAERADAHRRLGEAIERFHADDLQPYLTTLARHFIEAGRYGDPRRGIGYAIRAAEREALLMAHPEAARLYADALSADERCSALSASERCTVLMKLAEVRWRHGDFGGARAAGSEAFARAGSLDEESFGRAALAFAGQLPGYGAAASDPDVVLALREAIKRVQDDRSSLRPLLLVRLAEELTFAVCGDDRFELVEEARRIAATLGDAKLEAALLRMGQWALWQPDGVATRRSLAERTIASARVLGDTVPQLDGELLHLWSALEHGDLVTVVQVSARCTELARSCRLPYYVWLAKLAEACVALTTSRLDDAFSLAQEAHQLGQASGNPNAMLFYGVLWGHLQWLRGAFATVSSWLEEIARMFPALATTAAVGQAITLSEWGRLDDARTALSGLGDGDLANLPRNVSWLLNVAYLAEVAVRTQAKEAAQRLYDALAPFAAYQVLLPPVLSFGPVSHHLANLAVTLERWSDAEAHFLRALASEKTLRSTHWLARTKIDYARFLVLRPNGAGSEAAQLLVEAREVATALSLPSWIARCEGVEALLAAAPAPPERAHHCRFQELDDAFLIVCDGLERRLQKIHGLHIMQRLFGNPDRPFHVEDLVRNKARRAAVAEDGDDPILDAKTAHEIKPQLARLVAKRADVVAELDARRDANDIGWIETLQGQIEEIDAEIEELNDYLSDRRRSFATTSDKCRQNTWHALEKAFTKVEEHFQLLGQHLRSHVSRGRFCTYRANPLWVFEL